MIKEHYSLGNYKHVLISWAGVVAQFVELSLHITEIRGSNPVICNFIDNCVLNNCFEKTKIQKRGREWHIKKQNKKHVLISDWG